MKIYQCNISHRKYIISHFYKFYEHTFSSQAFRPTRLKKINDGLDLEKQHDSSTANFKNRTNLKFDLSETGLLKIKDNMRELHNLNHISRTGKIVENLNDRKDTFVDPDLYNKGKENFFGIDMNSELTSEETKTNLDKRSPAEEIYEFMDDKPVSSTSEMVVEKVIEMPYGLMRLDKENLPESERKRFLQFKINRHQQLKQISDTDSYKNNLNRERTFVEDGHSNTIVDTCTTKDSNSSLKSEPKHFHNHQQQNSSEMVKQTGAKENLESKNHESEKSNFFDECYFPGQSFNIQNDNQINSSENNIDTFSPDLNKNTNFKKTQKDFDSTLSSINSNTQGITNDTKTASEKTTKTFSENGFNGVANDSVSPIIELNAQYNSKQSRKKDSHHEYSNLFDQQYFPDLTKNSSSNDLSEVHDQDISSATSNETRSEIDAIATKTLEKPLLFKSSSSPKTSSKSRNDLQNPKLNKKQSTTAESLQSNFVTNNITTENGLHNFAKRVEVESLKSNQKVNSPDTKSNTNSSAFEAAMEIRSQLKNKSNTSTRTERQSQGQKSDAHIDFSVPTFSTKWKGKRDSKGFRILTEQVTDLKWLTTDDLVSQLKMSIIYSDENIIVINKPYGLPSHGGPSVHHSVASLLKGLKERIAHQNLDDESFKLVHRLDKETTGVMLLARNSLACVRLRDLFIRQEVIKKYWLITKGVPEIPQGTIEIPMAEGTVGSDHRMALRPETDDKELQVFIKKTKHKNKHPAITHYKVLHSNKECALVECQPQTGIKHQIRCHMAFALNTPILGDHKYSHVSKIAPQKLFPSILQALNIRQAKVRHLPMHLHAKEIVLPGYYEDGRNLHLSAPLPPFFLQNMSWLKVSASRRYRER